jgi:hypothetical protein
MSSGNEIRFLLPFLSLRPARSATEAPSRVIGQTVTTILPNCSFDSRKRCASTIWSKGKVLAMTGLIEPDISPSRTKALAAASRAPRNREPGVV